LRYRTLEEIKNFDFREELRKENVFWFPIIARVILYSMLIYCNIKFVLMPEYKYNQEQIKKKQNKLHFHFE